MNLYQLLLPRYKKVLSNLDAILTLAEKWASERKVADETVLKARLALDMFPFVKQVQIVCDNAKGTCARLCGQEPIKFEDNEATFAELHTRIAKTLELLDTCKESDFEGAAERLIAMPYHGNRKLRGEHYVWEYALPNLFFHFTTAYDILRSNGVPLGKSDYLGELSLQD